VSANLAALLSESATAHRSRPALLDAGERVEYADLEARAMRCAGVLARRGVRAGDRVGIQLPNGTAFAAAFYGALRLGAIAVPLNALLKPPEVSRRLEHAGAAAIVTASEEAAGQLDRIDPEAIGDAEPIAAIARREPGDTAIILYTSGTTAGANGVELTHGGLRAQAEFVASSVLRLTPADVVLGAVPLAHVFGLSAALDAPIASGSCVALMSRFEASAALELMVAAGTTVFLGVPTMCLALLEAAAEDAAVPPLRIAHSGGASLSPETLGAFARRFGCEIVEGYGMTEVGGLVATQRPGRPSKAGSVGTAAGPIELRLTGDDGADVATAVVGEILVRGPARMKRYWRDPAATRDALRDGDWLATGDLGYRDEDGDLFLVDRKKDVILRGGYTVYPREVEDVLYAHPDVLEAVVLGIPDERLGEEIVALVVPRAGRAGDPEELREFARERVAAYKYPRLVVVVESLPHGGSGKVLRREIDREPLRRALDENLTRRS
jgi:long-chain acyl-CoA synthetase